MALYKNPNVLVASTDQNFDTIRQPGSTTPFSAIYRCVGCNKEIVSEQEKPLPAQNHHQHTSAQGAIRWQMVVFAQHTP